MKRYFALICAILILTLCACSPDNVKTPEQTPKTPESGTEVTPSPSTTVEKHSDETPKENTGVMPSALPENASALKGKTVTLFTSDSSAFYVGETDEFGWFDALKKEYDITVAYNKRTKSTLFTAQMIASRSGADLDVITADVNDCVSALSLMKSTDTVPEGVFSKSLNTQTGGKLFSALGNCRTLWYNTELVGNDSPNTLFNLGKWNTDAFKTICDKLKTNKKNILDYTNTIDFANAGDKRTTGLVDGKLVSGKDDETAAACLKAFADILGDNKGEFSKGDTAFTLADTPAVSGKIKADWVPVPSVSETGNCVATFCGKGMGVYANAKDTAVSEAFLSLWCARYSEFRRDLLIHKLGLSEDSVNRYVLMCENIGGMNDADAKIFALYNTDKQGEDEDLTSYIELINKRYFDN